MRNGWGRFKARAGPSPLMLNGREEKPALFRADKAALLQPGKRRLDKRPVKAEIERKVTRRCAGRFARKMIFDRAVDRAV